MIGKPILAVLIALAATLPLHASVTVPQDLRNPFEIPDPAGFKVQKNSNPKMDMANANRDAAFERIKRALLDLPVNGVVSNMRNTASSEVMVLLGKYTVRPGFEFPPSDFGIKGLIKVTSVSISEIRISVSIELETRPITLPLVR
jgi:hypothetical protein